MYMTSQTLRHSHLWLMIICILLASWLSASQLDGNALWYDEFFSIYDAGGTEESPFSLADVWNRVATRNPWHVPGFFLLLNNWGRWVGWGEPYALRTFALFIGTLTIAVVYRLGRDNFSPALGLTAAAVLSSSAFFIHYMHELRMYTLIALGSAILFTSYFRLIRRNYRVGWVTWTGVWVGAVMLLYTHYFASLVVAAIGLYHLVFAPKTSNWWGVVGIMGLAGMTFLPWLGALRDGLQLASEAEIVHQRAMDAPETLGWLAQMVSNRVGVLLVVVLMLAAIGTLPTHQPEKFKLPPRVLWFLAIMIPLLLVSANAILQLMHAGRLRYLMIAWVPLMLLLAFGIDAAHRLPRGRWVSPVLLLVWMTAGIWGALSGRVTGELDGYSYRIPTHIIERAVRSEVQPNDYLMIIPPDNIPSWRYRVASDYYLLGVGEGYYISTVANESGAETLDTPEDVLIAAGDRERLWLAYLPDENPPQFQSYINSLSTVYQQCKAIDTSPELDLSLWTRSPICCEANAPVSGGIQFGDGIQLAQHDPLPAVVSDTLTIRLGWKLDQAVTPYVYSVGLHVLDEAGQLVAQVDYGLPPFGYACESSTLDVSLLPAGSYGLHVLVYDWESGERLVGVNPQTNTQGERILLESFRVD